jgi:excisionase family DNA binding protein
MNSTNLQERASTGPRVPFAERIAVPVSEACAAGGFGVTTCYKLLAEGRLKSTKVGRRRLILVSSLRELMGEGSAT